MDQIAVFASGAGTNANRISRYFATSRIARVGLIFCNNPEAGVISIARELNIPCVIFNRADLYEQGKVLSLLIENKIKIIVLAGFLWKIPGSILNHFQGHIINIHPALLPLHGGKGFYGEHVHRAVLKTGTAISGITIHHVTEEFDDGEIIFQAACHVAMDETPESLAKKIHELEYRYFPVVIEKYIRLKSEHP